MKHNNELPALVSERPSFFAELKRRNVYKVAAAYAVVGWLVLQAASILLPTFHAPDWVMQTVVALVVLGFPIALVLAWAFELTPEGIKRAEDVAPGESIRPKTGRKIVALTTALAALAAALLVYQIIRARSGANTGASTSSANSRSSEAMVGTQPSIPEKSIAVLPFDSLSEDKNNAYFAEGIQDEILTRLAKVADLKVISRTSTQHFKSSPENLPQIAKQLGVMHVVEGTVQKVNDQVRVNVQLVNAITDAHLWAEIYDRKLIDIFAVERDIAKTIAETLQAKLTGSEQRAISARPTENPEAYQLYLQGRFFWNKRTVADLRRSIDYFNRAIANDPKFASAYAGLAQAWMVLPAYNGGPPIDCSLQAEAAARKALAIDETSSDAMAVLASFKALYQFDFPSALKDYERALQIKPNDATTHHWFAEDVLTNMGQQQRELEHMRRALELDPLSLIIHTNLGVAYLHNGMLDEAIAQFRHAIEMDGSFYFARWNWGLALQLKGNNAEAMAQYKKAAALTDDPIVQGMLGQFYAVSGRKSEAQKILEKLREARAQRYTAAYALALGSLGLGDRSEALTWLEQGYRDRDGDWLGPIRIDPLLKPLHGDPRFEALAEKIVPASEFKSAASK